MEENRFWIRLWGITATVLVCFVGACTYSGHDKRDKWEKAVSNGADPMVTACALFTQGQVEAASCLLLAQNRK